MTTSPAILFVIAPENFRDEELFVPLKHMQDLGWSTTVASPKTGTASGMLGGSFPVETALDGLDSSHYQALVVVGGSGSPQWLWDNKSLHTLAKGVADNGGIVSAICLSGVALAKAGLLTGKQATVWSMPESLAAYETADVTYVDSPVVTDGRLITANGPEAAEAFAVAIEAGVKATMSQSV